jgi:hypothetical protein
LHIHVHGDEELVKFALQLHCKGTNERGEWAGSGRPSPYASLACSP